MIRLEPRLILHRSDNSSIGFVNRERERFLVWQFVQLGEREREREGERGAYLVRQKLSAGDHVVFIVSKRIHLQSTKLQCNVTHWLVSHVSNKNTNYREGAFKTKSDLLNKALYVLLF